MFPKCGLDTVLDIVVLCVVVSRWYRLRSRNNPINIHHMVETHMATLIIENRNISRENITTYRMEQKTEFMFNTEHVTFLQSKFLSWCMLHCCLIMSITFQVLLL